MAEGEIQEQLNLLNKKLGGGAKITRSPAAIDNASDDAIERLLKQCAQFSQEKSLIAASALKKNGHVPAALAFANDENGRENASHKRSDTKSVDALATDLSSLICS